MIDEIPKTEIKRTGIPNENEYLPKTFFKVLGLNEHSAIPQTSKFLWIYILHVGKIVPYSLA